MKIQKTNAYIVEIDNIEFHAWRDSGRYLRLGCTDWYYLLRDGIVDSRVYKDAVNILEKEFQETINVIHEQLPLL